MIRQKKLRSHMWREGRMLHDSFWGCMSTPTRLGDEENTVACPWLLFSVKGYLNPCPMMSLLKPLFSSINDNCWCHWSTGVFTPWWVHLRVNVSLLPAWVTLEKSMSLTFHTMPLGLNSLWGLAVLFRAELRQHGSQTGKVLGQTIYMKFLNLYRFS